jgi:hypothetical protein
LKNKNFAAAKTAANAIIASDRFNHDDKEKAKAWLEIIPD